LQRPIITGAARFVFEDALAAGFGERIPLQIEVLVIGADAGGRSARLEYMYLSTGGGALTKFDMGGAKF
jgi:hypothetical protein